MKYRLLIPAYIEEAIRVLPPSLKRQIRAGLEAVHENPFTGKPLRDELKDYWAYRVNRYRIVYQIVHPRIEIHVVGIGPRAVIYERVLASSRQKKN